MTFRVVPAVLCTGLLLTSVPAAARGQEFLGKSVARWQDDLAPTKSAAERRSAAFALGKIGKAAVPALAALAARLDDLDAAVREAAVFAIGEICGQARVFSAELLKSLCTRLQDDKTPMVRRSAAFALGNIGKVDAAVKFALDGALKDTDPAVRQNVAWALGRMGDNVVGSLRRALKDGDALVRRDAIGALGRLSETAAAGALPELLDCCRQTDTEARKAAYAALVRLVRSKNGATARAALLKGLKDAEPEIRYNAALAFAGIGGPDAAPAVPVLIGALKASDQNLRRQAALALGSIGPTAKEAVPHLRAALTDPDQAMRFNAAVAFIGLKEVAEPAVPDLARMLADKKESAEVRAQAGVALSRIGFCPALVKALPTLLRVAADKGEKCLVRERALWPLRVSMNYVEDREPFYKLLSGILAEPKRPEGKLLRYDAAYVLGMFRASEAPDAVLDGLEDFLRDPGVKVYDGVWRRQKKIGEPGAGPGSSGEKGTDDGRIMVIDALKRIGLDRVARRPALVAQLRALRADPKTPPNLADRLKDYLPELERHLKQKGIK